MSEKEEKEEKEPGFVKRFMNGEGPVRNFLKQTTGLTEDNLTNEQKKLTDAFREGIAEALGIPPENIGEELIMRWVLEFTRAFVKPEHLKETIIPPLQRIKKFGNELGLIVRQAIERLDQEPKTDYFHKLQPSAKVTEDLIKPEDILEREEQKSDISIE